MSLYHLMHVTERERLIRCLFLSDIEHKISREQLRLALNARALRRNDRRFSSGLCSKDLDMWSRGSRCGDPAAGFTRTESRSAGRKPKARTDHAIRRRARLPFRSFRALFDAWLTFRASEFEWYGLAFFRGMTLSWRGLSVIFGLGHVLPSCCLWWSRVLRSRFPSPPLNRLYNRAPELSSRIRFSDRDFRRAYAIAIFPKFTVDRSCGPRIWHRWKRAHLGEKIVRSIIDSSCSCSRGLYEWKVFWSEFWNVLDCFSRLCIYQFWSMNSSRERI